ncbi:tripartite tricarboxylate transporter substrate-binding protein [Elioraea sp.]|uniref:tripartite tricarboxylate transporter substrate-binding protein n=1 Tax=Elioraea sp. TaxID=2185103 RepID=UPI00307D6246
MTPVTRRILLGTATLAPFAARAQAAWPTAPVRIIIPFAPGGVPAAIVERLHAEVAKAAHQPDVAERMQQLGYELVVSTPAELAAFQRREREKWGEVIRRGNISIEN